MVCVGITCESDGTMCLPSQLDMIVTALQESLQHTHLCDVTVSISGQFFQSHKFLLSTMSEYFSGYFASHAGEYDVDISHLKAVSEDSFQLFLQFAYSSKLLLQSVGDAKGMLNLCRGLAISSPLKEACCAYLSAKLTSDNCTEILSLAEEFHLPDLEKDAKGLLNKLLIEFHDTYMKQDARTEHSIDETSLDELSVNVSTVKVSRPLTRPRKPLPTRPFTNAKTNQSSVVPSHVPPGSKLRVETKAALKRFPRSRRKAALPVQIIHDGVPPAPTEPITNVPEIQNEDAPETLQDGNILVSNSETAVSSVILTKKTRDCKVCDMKDFHTLKELQYHCRKYHVRCITCRRLLASRVDLREHMLKHNRGTKKIAKKKFDCSFCFKKFNYASAMKVHLRTHTGEKPFECKFCLQRFTQSINLYRHVLSYHEPDAPKYRCKVCCKEFSVQIYLKSHEIMHSEKRPFQCEECGALFKRKNDMQSHQRVHTSEKPHRCELCLNCFKTIGDLRAHMQIHNSSKPHCCSQCGITFKRSGHLNRHMKTHSSDKPFKCSECNAAFKRKENLANHLRTHTSDLPYKCEQCDAQYKHSSSLKAHAKKHCGDGGPDVAGQLCFIQGGKSDQSGDISQALPSVMETDRDVQVDASIGLPSDGSFISVTQGNIPQSGIAGGTKFLYLQAAGGSSHHTLIPLSDVFSEVGESVIADTTAAGLSMPVVTLPQPSDSEDGPTPLLGNASGDLLISR